MGGMPSKNLEKFQDSMKIGYAEWREGIGYDLDALGKLTPEERIQAEDLLIARHAADWRDIEALDVLGSSRALEEMRNALSVKDVETRIEAAEHLAKRKMINEACIESIIVMTLDVTTLLNGMVRTLRFAEAHPSPAVQSKLWSCALDGDDSIRGHAAALAHFLAGGSASAFDWNFRPIYLCFTSQDKQERHRAYLELRAKIEQSWK